MFNQNQNFECNKSIFIDETIHFIVIHFLKLYTSVENMKPFGLLLTRTKLFLLDLTTKVLEPNL